MLNSAQIRRTYLEYFEKNGHAIVASSSLIPAEDPTLLFTNAGMNQFKDLFLGKETRSYKRATSSQKCVRAGGKHNDLEQVGFTKRHLTFFEMLGNFSFGDYFKKEAIQFAWNLLTQEYGLDAERLYISVYYKDDEAFEIWNTIVGVPAERIVKLDEKDNFWAMGDTGPCGPCTEIYFDKHPGTPGKPGEPEHDERFLEIWNVVFMQYNRSADGTLVPLAQTGVDTGMGLERLCVVLEEKETVFQTSVFAPIRDAISRETGINYWTAPIATQAAFNVICDHVRSSSLLLADGCMPANDGRGYVLRKIIRRASLFAQKLSDNRQFLVRIAQAFIAAEKAIFPELGAAQNTIATILQQEVDRFSHNLMSGRGIADKYIMQQQNAGAKSLSGKQAFTLYDTYGFPLELTRVIAGEAGLMVDEHEFQHYMEHQQEQSKQKKEIDSANITFPENLTTRFVGYETTEAASTILWEHTESAHRWIITAESPLYVESGGQVNDEGVVTINEHSYAVVDLKKVGSRFSPAIAVCLVPFETMGDCAVGDTAHITVDKDARIDTVRNHTATHMLHAALHTVLGEQAKQAGSVVNKDYLRFDFTSPEALTRAQITQIENLVNEKIWENIETDINTMSLEAAQQKGAIAFFGEKYNPESVRVVSIPGFSTELCGGTHASATGIIGQFKITSETALSTGTRRLTAVTGRKALELAQQNFGTCKLLGEQFKVKSEEICGAVEKQTEQLRETQREIKQLQSDLVNSKLTAYRASIITSGAVPHLVISEKNLPIDALRSLIMTLVSEQPGIYAVVSYDSSSDRSQFIIVTHQECIPTVTHATLIEALASAGLRGGGKPGMLQGGAVGNCGETLTKIIHELAL